MIVTDKLRRFVAGQPGEKIAVSREQLLQIFDEIDLGNAARVREQGRGVVDRFQEAMA